MDDGRVPAEPSHPLLAHDRASAWLGVRVQRIGDGHATITMAVRQEMLNGFGIAHGGMIFALADTAFALACNPASPADQPPGQAAGSGSITVAAGADINFVRPALPGQVLTAVADRRHQAGRSGIYDISIYAEGELVAEFRGRSRTVPRT